MNQKNKIIICSVGIIVGLAIILCSIFLINNNPSMNNMSNGNNQSSQPSMPSNNMTPPDNSTTNQNSSSSDSQTNQGPSSNSSQNNQGPMNSSQAPTNMNNQQNSSLLKTIGIILGSLILSLSIVYLIISKLGSINIFTSLDKIMIYVLINIILTAGLTFGINTLSSKYLVKNDMPSMPTENNNTTTNNDSDSSDTI